MAVHLTRIYTKTGDDGTTALGDMSRTPKTAPRVGAYADVDETNAAIGVALAVGGVDIDEGVRTLLAQVQNDLFDVGADLCTPITPDPKYPPLRVTDPYVERLEAACDRYNERLPKLDSFLLPGGTAAAAHLHRLSDLLFILARVANPDGDVLWRPGAQR
jgi:cob(I)alamin adenosyltransferase